jgi:hypothetical protein
MDMADSLTSGKERMPVHPSAGRVTTDNLRKNGNNESACFRGILKKAKIENNNIRQRRNPHCNKRNRVQPLFLIGSMAKNLPQVTQTSVMVTPRARLLSAVTCQSSSQGRSG